MTDNRMTYTRPAADLIREHAPIVTHPTGRDNFTIVSCSGADYAYSYATCIGINRCDGRGWIVRVNEWSTTTGKHLNYLDGGSTTAKRNRADTETFAAEIMAGPLSETETM